APDRAVPPRATPRRAPEADAHLHGPTTPVTHDAGSHRPMAGHPPSHGSSSHGGPFGTGAARLEQLVVHPRVSDPQLCRGRPGARAAVPHGPDTGAYRADRTAAVPHESRESHLRVGDVLPPDRCVGLPGCPGPAAVGAERYAQTPGTPAAFYPRRGPRSAHGSHPGAGLPLPACRAL